MSAFIVSQKTMSDIYLLIKELATKPVDEEKLGRYIQKMYDMNVDAVNYRYSETTPHIPFVNAYENEIVEKPSMVQMYKSLYCLLYQCSEGEYPDTRLFQEMEELLSKSEILVAKDILLPSQAIDPIRRIRAIEASDEYARAEWDRL